MSSTRTIHDLISECLNKMSQEDLCPIDQQLKIDGQLHRYSCRLDKPRDIDEWYVAHNGVSPNGTEWLTVTYASYRHAGEKHVYKSSLPTDRSEREHIARAQTLQIQSTKKDIEKTHLDAEKTARNIWDKATKAHTHPYLELKKVHAEGLKIGEDSRGNPSLILPLRDIHGEIKTLQFITTKSPHEKRYLFGGKKKGSFHVLGQLTGASKCYVCEGYATGATIYELMQTPVVVAFDCINLDAVITELRKTYPRMQITICADDDRFKEKNAGRETAQALFVKHRVRYLIPHFSKPDDPGTDFNDLFISEGSEVTRKQLFIDIKDEVAYEMNQRYTVEAGANSSIIENETLIQLGKDSFKLRYQNQTIEVGGGKFRSKANIWLNHPERRTVKGIIFRPHQNPGPDWMNLWSGFAYEPIPGDSQFFWDHAKEVICDGNEEAYLYLRKWLAIVFQKPEILHTALILMGGQGTGKNAFVDALGHLLGRHYLTADTLDRILGRFNSHLQSIILLHANEALWADKQSKGALKAMITDSSCAYEGKGREIREDTNYKHIIMSTNESLPVSIDMDDRRMVILKVSDKHQNDHAYFKKYFQSLNSGGYEPILYDLLNEDLSGFNPRQRPGISEDSKDMMFQMKLQSAGHLAVYIQEVLDSGFFDCYSSEPQKAWGKRKKQEIYQCYVDWFERNKIRQTLENNVHFFRKLHKMLPSVTQQQIFIKGERPRILDVPTLEIARLEFESTFLNKIN